MQKKTVYPEWVQQYRTKGTTVKKSEILIISIREPRKGLLEKNIPSRLIHI